MKPIRLLLADDHQIVRKGLRSLVENKKDIQVVAEASDGKEAVRKAIELKPDVVLMDIRMPRLNGIEATKQIKKERPGVRVLILTVHIIEYYILQILRAGASGYLSKKASTEELITAIRQISAGELYFGSEISKVIVKEYIKKAEVSSYSDAFDILTSREREVLQLIGEGNTTRMIADQLFISVKTVESHRQHIMKKLGLHNLSELIKYAINKGITENSS